MKARLKKCLSGILTLALLLGLMPALTLPASAADVMYSSTDGTTPFTYASLTGTSVSVGDFTFTGEDSNSSHNITGDAYGIYLSDTSLQPSVAPTGTITIAPITGGQTFTMKSITVNAITYIETFTIKFGSIAVGTVTIDPATPSTYANQDVNGFCYKTITFSDPGPTEAVNIEISSTDSSSNPYGVGFAGVAGFTASTPITPPTVTSVSPTSGSTTGGTSVTITGTGFTGATAVKFGSTSAGSYTISSDTQITATAPAGSGTVDVTVTTSAGTSATSAADQFTYAAPNTAPTLTASAANPPFTENGSAVSLFSGASVSAGEGGQTITELKLTVGGLADGASEILRADGTAIALTNGNSGTTTTNTMTYAVSVSGGMATITLSKSDGISAAAMQALIDGIAYQNTSDAPTGANRTVTITSIKDSGGTANGGVDTTTLSIASIASIIAVNDAPTDISLSPNVVNQSTGANAEVGTLSAADPDTGDTFTYTLVSGTGDTNNASFNISGSILYANNASAMTAGAYSVRIRVSDGSLTYEKALTVTVIDNVAPAAPIIATAITVTNSPTPTLEGIAEANSTVKLYDTDGTTVLGTATANGSGSWSIVSSSLSDGAHTITAKAVDGAGNTSAASSGRAITIDTTAPTSAIVVTPAALRVGETATVTFIFSEAVIGFTNADLTVPNGTLSAVSSTDGGITWTATFTPTANVEAVSNIITLANSGFADMAGNTGTGTTTSNNYSIDAVAPTVISVVPPVNGTYTAGQALDLIVVFIEPSPSRERPASR